MSSKEIISVRVLLVGALTGTLPPNLMPLINLNKHEHAAKLKSFVGDIVRDEPDICVTSWELLLSVRDAYATVRNAPGYLYMAFADGIQTYLEERIENPALNIKPISASYKFFLNSVAEKMVKYAEEAGISTEDASMEIDAQDFDPEELLGKSIFEVPSETLPFQGNSASGLPVQK